MSSDVSGEAAEQPSVIAALLDREDEFRRLAGRLRGRFTSILVVARGSSDNAARYAQYLFGIRNRLSVALATPSVVTRYGAAPDLTGSLVIAISQSGASPDIAAVTSLAVAQGVPTVAITNAPSSPLASVAEECIDLGTGPERAVAATKTYTASLAALAMLSRAISGDVGSGTDLSAVPDAVRQVLDARLPDACLEHWVAARRGIVVARGYEYATAHETAIKMQELAGVIAQPHSAADVHHGPVAGLTGDVPIMLFATQGAVADDLVATARRLALRGPVTTIGTVATAHEHATWSWSLPEVAEWVAPMVTAVAGQRLAIALARRLGLDPDQPAGLQKITRTR